jgi:hypothetical protein
MKNLIYLKDEMLGFLSAARFDRLLLGMLGMPGAGYAELLGKPIKVQKCNRPLRE